jgi:undecaprenyl-diphosphatase
MEFIEIIKAVILGVVEGITEWLPISSTGHMILVDEFLKLNVSPAFKEMFLVVIQLGAILAVVVLYFHKLNPFSSQKTRKEKNSTLRLWIKVIIAVIPAGIIGAIFDEKLNLLFYNFQTVAVTLILYGILFIVAENYNKSRVPSVTRYAQLSYKRALLIGVFQVLSLIPGTSRSGATILGAILLGTSRGIAAEFSFFLAIPVMFGASALKVRNFGFSLQPMEWAILITGMAVAFLVSIIAIKFLTGYVKRNDFKVFGYYRIVLGIIVLLYWLIAKR